MPRNKNKLRVYSPTDDEKQMLRSLREKIRLITIDNGSVDPLLVDIAMYKAIAHVFKVQ